MKEDRETSQTGEVAVQDKKRRRLTPQQGAFVSLYANPESPTYGNGTQSVIAVPGRRGKSYAAARAQAVDYLSNPNIQSEIEALATQSGLTSLFRLKRLKDIADGQYVREVWKDEEGRVHETPKASEVIKALDVVNKMTGLYEKNRAMMNATTERFRGLVARFKPVEVPFKEEKPSTARKTKKRPPALSLGYWPLLQDEPATHAEPQEAVEA